jgi:hypothetical protein
MFLKIVVFTPLWQIAPSIVLLALGIVGVLWVAARVYRVGILMYGKKPTFLELVKWVRRSRQNQSLTRTVSGRARGLTGISLGQLSSHVLRA